MEACAFVDAALEIHSHSYGFNRGCAAYVCTEGNCDDHRGLARCWCGWSLSGQNGQAELIEMGETIEAEDY